MSGGSRFLDSLFSYRINVFTELYQNVLEVFVLLCFGAKASLYSS